MDDSLDNFRVDLKIRKKFPCNKSHENKRNKLSRANARIVSSKSVSQPLKSQNKIQKLPIRANTDYEDQISKSGLLKSAFDSTEIASKYFPATIAAAEKQEENWSPIATDESQFTDSGQNNELQVHAQHENTQVSVTTPETIEEKCEKLCNVSATEHGFKENLREPLKNDIHVTVDSPQTKIQNGNQDVVTRDAYETSTYVEIKNELATLECPVCGNMIEETTHAEHVRSCFTNKFEHSTGSCELCFKDISHMNVQRQRQHVNCCLNRQNPTTFQPDANSVCPFCGVFVKTENQKFAHLKRCSKKLGLEPQKIIEASRLLEKQASERKALGLPTLPLHGFKQSSPKKRHFATAPRSNADAEMQMALAISASLERDDSLLPLQIQKRGKRKNNNRLPDCLMPLVLQTEMERQKLLEQKVAVFIFPQTEENMEVAPGNAACTLDENHLWTKTCTLESDTYYVDNLKDFIPQEPTKCLLETTPMKLDEQAVLPKDNLETAVVSSEAGGFYEIGEVEDKKRSLESDMKKLVGNSHLSDLSILTSDCEIPAHKLIFSVRCPQILKSDSSMQKLDWSDFPSAVVLEFLECIYTGAFNPDRPNAGDKKHQVLKLAYKYGVRELFQDTNVEEVKLDDVPALEDAKLDEEDLGNLLGDDEIEEIRQYSQVLSQHVTADEGSHSSSHLRLDIINQLLDDEVSILEGCSHVEQQKSTIDCSEDDASFCASSPDLFESSSDETEVQFLHEKVTCSPLNKTLVSDSPVKSIGGNNFSVDGTSIKDNDVIVLSNSSEEHQQQNRHSKTAIKSPSPRTRKGSENSETMLTSPNKEFDELPPISTFGFHWHSSPRHKSPSGSPNVLRTSPMKNTKKRSLEDVSWKTPKRSNSQRHSQSSPTDLEDNNFDLGNDIWADFENECCIEMLETPKMQNKTHANMQISPPTSQKFDSQDNQVPKTCSVDDQQVHKRTVSKTLTQPIASTSKLHKFTTPKSKSLLSQQPLTKVYDQVTPFPNYRKMITPELRNALKKYGVRKLPRSKAVLLLNHIYELTHPFVDDNKDANEETSKTTQPGEKLKKGTKTGKNNVESKSPKGKSKTSKHTTRMRVTKTKKCTTKNVTPDELSSSQNSSCGEMPEESTREHASTVPELKIIIKQYIRGDKDLYDKVLLYEPIAINELHQNLKQNCISVTMPQLMDFLDEECITFTLPRGENYRKKQQVRSQKFRKRVLAKIS